jgi:PKD repeat protein
MKRILLSVLGLFLMQIGFAQNFNSDFLDGRLMFRLKTEAIASIDGAVQMDPNIYSLTEDLKDYPILEAIFAEYGVVKFERPSYFIGKKDLQRIFRVTFNDHAKIDELLNKLKSLNIIEFVTKEPIYKTGFIPNDTNHTGTDKWYHTLVGSENAWNISLGRNGVKIAIIDNAVFSNHLDLTTFKQYDVADNDNDATPPTVYASDMGWSHGTHCAGLATADINNSRGIASLGGNVELIGVKCTPNSAPNSGALWYSYEGIQWACQNGAHVVSMSFGGPSSSAALQALINAYPEVVFLAAAGNDGNSTVQYPAGYNNVIGVGSVDANNSRSSFSNFNGGTTFVDIASPGGYSNGGLLSSVYTTGANSYAKMGGTSMATPFAAGLVGLMLSVNPILTPTQVLNCLISTGVAINQNIGPRINALAAMQCVQATVSAGKPVADFLGLPRSIQEGDAVTFYDNSANNGTAIISWVWTFQGGTPSTFVGQNPPAISYATAGIYDVSLKVTNAQDSTTISKTDYITVSIAPYGEWIRQNSGFTTANRGINHISIVDANTVWALGYDGSGAMANVQQFTKTTNGGATWTPGTINVGNTALGISMIHALDANTAWLAAYPTAGGQTGGIWKTTNGGTAWTRQTTATFNNAASFTNVVHFWNANEGFCQGDPINGEFEIYRTTNGGTNWTLVPGANIPNPLNANEFGYTRGIEVVGDTIWFTTSVGRIYRSVDRGLNWTAHQTPVADFGGAVTTGITANLSFGTGLNGLIIDINGIVYKSTNAGTTWSTLPTTGSVYTNGICWVENTNIIFSTGAGAGTSGSSYSEDGGSTWNIIDTEQHLYVEFTTPSIGWSGWFNASASSNGMWKWNSLSSPFVTAFSGTRNVCVGTAVNFTDQTTGATPTGWQWSFPGGTPSTSIQQNPTVTYSVPGIYPVSLTVTDGINLSTYSDTAYITAVTLPAQPSAISGNAAVCPFAVETYTVTNVPNVFYTWTLSSGWAGTSSSNSINVTMNDTSGVLSVTAFNVCGNSTASNINISIGALPVANFSYVDNNGVVDFTNASAFSSSWSWNFGDGNTSANQTPQNTYDSTGTYTVTLVSFNSCGDSDTSVQVITVSVISSVDVSDAFTSVSLYPNPANQVLTVDGLPTAAYGESLRIIDLLGRTVQSVMVSNEIQTLDISSLSSGMYTLEIKGRVFKFVKRN